MRFSPSRGIGGKTDFGVFAQESAETFGRAINESSRFAGGAVKKIQLNDDRALLHGPLPEARGLSIDKDDGPEHAVARDGPAAGVGRKSRTPVPIAEDEFVEGGQQMGGASLRGGGQLARAAAPINAFP
jgi:hypothetical protein